MTAFLAHPYVFLPCLALAALGLIVIVCVAFIPTIDPIAPHPGTRVKHRSSHARPPRRPLAALAHARPRIPHLRHQPILSLPPRLVSRLRAAARHFPAGRDAAPLTAEDKGTYEWARDDLHGRRQLGPAAPARYPRHLANAWMGVAAFTRALPLGLLPHLQRRWEHDTGQWPAYVEGER